MSNLYTYANLKVTLSYDRSRLRKTIATKLKIPLEQIKVARVVKESLDARKKTNMHFVLQVEFETDKILSEPLFAQVRLLSKSRLKIDKPISLQMKNTVKPQTPTVVVGAGPAGLFAALALAEANIPTVLLERGKPVETRMRDIGQLRSHGVLDPESNVCFGEGGAGAYTDGKLYTRVKHPYVSWVMSRFVEFGAPEDILIKAHPHLGTDKLIRIVKRMREHLVKLGVQVRFQSRLERLLLRKNRVVGLRLSSGEEIATNRVILGIGHSARDTLAQLVKDGVHMEAKSFAVGVRVEHPQALINLNQFGSEIPPTPLKAAAYHLTYQHLDANGSKRGVYSFCMCPGGFIVPSPTEASLMAVNGMSNANRSTAYANSGVVTQIEPEMLLRVGYQHSALMGIDFQRDLEQKTFEATNQPYAAPAMRVTDFVDKRSRGTLAPTHFRPAAEPKDLWEFLPRWVLEPLSLGFQTFNRKIKGYVSSEANLLAVESRTSSPVRICRKEDMQSTSTLGLYPVGEGAGYAGGIVSAAVDGLKAVESMLC